MSNFRQHLDDLATYLEKDLGPEKIDHVRKLIRAAIHEGVEDLERVGADKEKLLKDVSSVFIRQLKEWGNQNSEYRDSLNRLGVELTNATNCETLGNCLNTAMEIAIPASSDGLDAEHVHRQREERYKSIIALLTEGLSKIASQGSKATQAMDSHASQIDSVVKLGDLDQIRTEMDKVAKSIRHTNAELRSELEEATQKVKQASARIESLEKKLHVAREEGVHDELTQIFNRRALNQYLSRLIESRDHTSSWGFVIFDIDFFKEVNDKYGHTVGDEILTGTAQLLRKGIRASDFLARYGGEELVLILPGATVAQGRRVADKLRRRVAQTRWKVRQSAGLFDRGESVRITVSAGVAEFRAEDSADSLIDRADRALYVAKEAGRNKVRTEKDAEASAK